MTLVLTLATWIKLTNGPHLKDDLRELARLGDGGWLSIQASRHHECEPRLDNAKQYRSVEIGTKGVLEGPDDAALLLQDYWRDRRGTMLLARVPMDIAEGYVGMIRGGIVV